MYVYIYESMFTETLGAIGSGNGIYSIGTPKSLLEFKCWYEIWIKN